MKTVYLFVVGVLISMTPLVAQQATDTPADVLEKSLLWEVTGNGLEQTSYVYGTIHMIDKDDFFFTEATEEAMGKAERFTFEIDMEDMNDMGKIMPIMMKAFMEGDTTLSDLLTDEEYQLVSDHFKKIGLPLMMLERIKPMFLSALTGEEMMMPGQEGGSMVSYEFEIMKKAQERKKPIEGLETMEFQMSLFDQIPYEDQAQMLVESIQSPTDSSADNQLDMLVQIYKNQDIEAMLSMMDDKEAGMGKYEDILLVSRNKNWIPAMEKMMKENTTFFAVGAGHLGGENGVIRLLRKAGYTLKPLY
ncbi:MAG TPA: TraB/GumN family protein [Saprospiraceae bacterium]|nr:TraB/GumN family protein [Saprospiraceae bacterium]